MNEIFLKRMQDILQDEYPLYIDALNNAPINRGFRVNTLKINSADFFKQYEINCHPSCFASDAYILDDDKTYGNSLPYALGLMIMQEPSASSVVEQMDIKPGDMVLDLCAAPGSKSTQIAQKLQGEGQLFANEIDGQRAQVLLSNLERLGVSNATITSASPDKICPKYQGLMDKVLVDAPCSGEGMFRKETQAQDNWSEEYVATCANRQLNILEQAYQCVKENGLLMYSTCTYSKEENELLIEKFLNNHPDMELLKIDVNWGHPGLETSHDTTKCRRIFLQDGGEGHFMAKMIKNSETKKGLLKVLSNSKLDSNTEQFLKSQLNIDLPYKLIINNRLYISNNPFIDLDGIKVLRSGVYVGNIEKGRFEPAQHFYKCFDITNYSHKYTLSYNHALAFMQGNVINEHSEKGYLALSVNNYVLGYGKSDTKQIKNHYPKGLRIR